MTVKDIFELRKQGRIEEAYDAIRPMYASHKGKYTSLCMFWTASDIFKLRLEQGRIDEATLIFQALKRVLPYINDSDGKAMAFMQYAARRLVKATQKSQKTQKEASPDPNPSNPINPCSKTDSSDSFNSCSKANPVNPDNSCSKTEESVEDYSGHLIVGLDEGLIDRPYDGINAPQTKVLDYIKSHEGTSVPKITAATGIPAKSVERHIAALIAKALIEHRGSKKTGGYYPL